MKIKSFKESFNKTTSDKPKTNVSESIVPIVHPENSFLAILEAIVPSNQESTRELNELWKQLPDLEKRFLKQPSHQNLTEYKMLVRNIVEAILKTNYKTHRAKLRGRTDNKLLTYVKVIDENLQILTQTMLSPANSAFSLLKQVEKIRGLLMDLKN
ncbi:MAG: DUF327 family protein [Leptospiraceae bacterium]|nr:DUF327 family protein [Leptospiraceae bacterium]MCP5493400.1 DUF327 family protein [Leptospiraceae bacterium]